MANLIIGNGEDLRALVDSLFTLRDPEKEAALSEEEREALRRKREEEIRLLCSCPRYGRQPLTDTQDMG